MKERPILFSAPMVCAILGDRKTQTRRNDAYMLKYPPAEKPELTMLSKSKGGEKLFTATWEATNGKFTASFCPYGKPGDRLWVRETFSHCFHGPYGFDVIYDADSERVEFSENAGATDAQLNWLAAGMENHDEINRPSIHMPRWASRITLEITGVRVERLQDISDEDAMAEGIWKTISGYFSYGDDYNPDYINARDAYRGLWESINGSGSWAANPWVWVIEFKKV